MRGVPLDAVLAHPIVVRLARALADRPGMRLPEGDATRRAAVALILRGTASGGLEILMIKRAAYEGDPWSGHIALPGGRQEAGDASLEDTAVRETREETAVDLAADGRIIGRLDELPPRTPVLPPIAIAPFVAALGGDVALRLSDEVDAAFWVPVAALQEAAAWTEMPIEVRGMRRLLPAFRHGDHVVWGLTERILRQFLQRLEP